MDLERMHHPQQRRRKSPTRSPADSGTMAPPTTHLNLSIPLHVHVPPLPSPNTTAAAAALFRVNQLPSSSTSLASPTVVDGLSFRKGTPSPSPSVDESAQLGQPGQQLKKPTKRQRFDASTIMAMYPNGAPTPTTAAAAAAAMMLSSASPAFLPYDNPSSSANTSSDQSVSASRTPTPSSASAPTDGLDANSSDMRRRKVGIPKFLRFLFQMLEYEDNAVIAWSHDGTAFQIRDPEELAERVLPKYFKHNKVSSFQRQLNYFGFKKWTKTQTNICTFSHPCFVRDQQDKMRLIKRKERSTRGTNTNTGNANDDDHEDDDDHGLSDDTHVSKLPASKRARLTVQPRPTTLSDPMLVKPRPTSASNASTHRRAPGAKKEVKVKDPKPSTATRGRKGSKPDGDAAPTRKNQQLPTISPTSSTTTAGVATVMSSATMHRLVANASPPSVYGTRNVTSDAAPVMAVHSELLLQATHEHQPTHASYMRRLRDVYDDDRNGQMSEEPYDGTPTSWQPHQASSSMEPTSYTLSSFKFSDGSGGGFDIEPTHTSYGGASAGQPPAPLANAKDYLDVLLEGASMDDQIATHHGSDLNAMASAWDTAYTHNQPQQQQHHHHHHQQQQAYVATAGAGGAGYVNSGGREGMQQTDRRLAEAAAIATYNILAPPPPPTASAAASASGTAGSSASTHSMQLPSIEDIQGARY